MNGLGSRVVLKMLNGNKLTILFLGQNIIHVSSIMKAQLLGMLVTVYMIQHTVTLAAYSIHTVRWAAANFTVCYILYLACPPILQEKQKKTKSKIL